MAEKAWPSPSERFCHAHNGGLLGYTERGQVVFISLPSGDARFITQLDIFVSGAATVR
jgi:hypothetical protein